MRMVPKFYWNLQVKGPIGSLFWEKVDAFDVQLYLIKTPL